jgi:hypothetical protein
MFISLVVSAPISEEKISWLASASAANLASLVSSVVGVGALILSVLIYRYGSTHIKRWLLEQTLTKKSGIAEAALDDLDLFKGQIENWLKMVYSAYDRYSTANTQQIDNANAEKKAELNEIFQSDLYELRNYYKKGEEIWKILLQAKNKAWRLNNKAIDTNFNDLNAIMKKVLFSLSIFHFVNATKDQKIEAQRVFSSAFGDIESLLLPIYEALRKDLFYH